MAKENLPTGFARRASGPLRVQIRLNGNPPVVKNFPLIGDGSAERRRQMADAEAWATETRRRLMSGSHVSTREAERTTLADAVRRYEAEGLRGDDGNVAVDRYRIGVILRDPIAKKPIATLGDKDVAAFRDRLLRQGWRKKVDAATRRLEKDRAPAARLAAVQALLRQRDEADGEAGAERRRKLEAAIAAVEAREGIKPPARTTIVNVTQLISRALDHLRQFIDGVPRLGGVRMPKASPGRERRVGPDEMSRLLTGAVAIDPVFPLLIDFAVATTLRRGRVLSFTLGDIQAVGRGVDAIAFPRAAAVRNKRTGVIPVTAALRRIIEEACAVSGIDAADRNTKVFAISAQQLTLWWGRLCGDLGIVDLHWHDLRHEGTSRLFERGLSTAEVMSITGHSTQEMVDRYSHYSAALVHSKLESGEDAAALASQIEFLLAQFFAAGGRRSDLNV